MEFDLVGCERRIAFPKGRSSSSRSGWGLTRFVVDGGAGGTYFSAFNQNMGERDGGLVRRRNCRGQEQRSKKRTRNLHLVAMGG